MAGALVSTAECNGQRERNKSQPLPGSRHCQGGDQNASQRRALLLLAGRTAPRQGSPPCQAAAGLLRAGPAPKKDRTGRNHCKGSRVLQGEERAPRGAEPATEEYLTEHSIAQHARGTEPRNSRPPQNVSVRADEKGYTKTRENRMAWHVQGKRSAVDTKRPQAAASLAATPLAPSRHARPLRFPARAGRPADAINRQVSRCGSRVHAQPPTRSQLAQRRQRRTHVQQVEWMPRKARGALSQVWQLAFPGAQDALQRAPGPTVLLVNVAGFRRKLAFESQPRFHLPGQES